MIDNQDWSGINEEISKLFLRFQEKLSGENSIDDLIASFQGTIVSSAEIIRNFTNVIENSVKDEKIKKESIEIINNILKEFEEIIKISKHNLLKNNISNDLSEEG